MSNQGFVIVYRLTQAQINNGEADNLTGGFVEVVDNDGQPTGVLSSTGPAGQTPTPIVGGESIKNNFAGTVAPTVTDDSASDYEVGSRWIDIVGNESYICTDASVGAAVWSQTTVGTIAEVAGLQAALDGKASSPSSADGEVQFETTSDLSSDPLFHWDNTTKSLGVGQSAAASDVLAVTGSRAGTVARLKNTDATGTSGTTFEDELAVSKGVCGYQNNLDTVVFGSVDATPVALITNGASFVHADSSGSTGLGTDTPGKALIGTAYDYSTGNKIVHIKEGTNGAILAVEGQNGAFLDLLDIGGGVDRKWGRVSMDAGFMNFSGLNDSPSAITPVIMKLDFVDGIVRFGNKFRMEGESPTAGKVLTATDTSGTATWSENDTVQAEDGSGGADISMKFWVGSQTEYDAIGTPDANTLYVINA